MTMTKRELKEKAAQAAYEKEQHLERSLGDITASLNEQCPLCLGNAYKDVKGGGRTPCMCLNRRQMGEVLRPVAHYRDLKYSPLSQHLRERNNLMIRVEGLANSDSLEEVSDVVAIHLKAALLALGDTKFRWSRTNLGVVMDLLLNSSEDKAHTFKDDLVVVTLNTPFIYEAMCKHVYNLMTSRCVSKKDAAGGQDLPTWFILPLGFTPNSWLQSAPSTVTGSALFPLVAKFLASDMQEVTINAKTTLASLVEEKEKDEHGNDILDPAVKPYGKPMTDKAISLIADLPNV